MEELQQRLDRLRGGEPPIGDYGDWIDVTPPCKICVSSGEVFNVRNHAQVINWICNDLQCAIVNVVVSLELNRRRVEGTVTGCAAVPLLWDLFAAVQPCWQMPTTIARNIYASGVPSERVNLANLELIKEAAASLLQVWRSAVSCRSCCVRATNNYQLEQLPRGAALHAIVLRLARAVCAVNRDLKAGQDRVAWLIVAKRRGIPRDVAKLVLRWMPLKIEVPEEYLKSGTGGSGSRGKIYATITANAVRRG